MRRRRSLFKAMIAMVAAALALMPAPAWAWSDAAHRLIAEIAYARLNPHARAEVDRLIATDAAGPVAGCAIQSFADASVWSDCVRRIPAFRNQSAWHYDDIPICGPIPPRETWCANGDCATAAIERSIRNLREGRGSDRDRLRALARLAHFIGDIHQPLHAADNGDRGGNEVAVAFAPRRPIAEPPANLHAAWDNALVRTAFDAAPSLAALEPIVRAEGAGWERGDAQSWAIQSNAIARSFIYRRWPQALACGRTPSAPVLIDTAYTQAAAPIVRRQLARAGVRLAATLNGIWH